MAGAAPTLIQRAQNSWDALTPTQRILAGMVLAFSNFMVVLDMTIANVSVPHIAGDVGVSADQGTWVITSYAVAEAICVPLTGWLAQRFGAVRVFLWAMMGFAGFSLLCGLSQTLQLLVVARIGQGLCGGPIMPMSQTLMVRVFPPEKRAMSMGLWAMTVILGPAMGPIVGGMISDNYSWHWIFFINVPIGVIVTFFGYIMLKPVETETRHVPIDKVGLALLVSWISCLQVLLDLGRDRDWFADPGMVMLGVASAIGFCAFVIWELTEEHPVVDLRIFRHLGFTTTVLTQALCFGAYFSGVVVVPQWLQITLGYTATQAGIVTALNAYAALIFSQVAARLLPRLDPRLMISFGTFWMGAMTFARVFWTSGHDMFTLGIPMLLQGVGMPFMFIPVTTMALSAVRPEETASAAGLQNFVRTMASAIATSIVLTVWTNAQSNARAMLVDRIHPAATQHTLTGMGLSPAQAHGYISALVDKEASTIAVDHAFLVATCVLFLASAIVWLTPRVPLTRLSGDATGGH